MVPINTLEILQEKWGKKETLLDLRETFLLILKGGGKFESKEILKDLRF